MKILPDNKEIENKKKEIEENEINKEKEINKLNNEKK